MKAEELRIGNFIQLDPSKDWVPREGQFDPIEVVSLSEKGLNYSWVDFSDVYWKPFEDFVGIPLTEELLVEFGFNKSIEYNIYGNYNVFIQGIIFLRTPRPDQNNGEPHKDCPDFYIMIGSDIVGITYVHQLQNLYFALTSEELTMKE